jgi:hypothetical protein
MSADTVEQVVRAALGAWALGLGLGAAAGGPPGPGDRPSLPHIGLSFGPTQTSHERLVAVGTVDAPTKASGPAALLIPGGAAGVLIPSGSTVTVDDTGLSYVTDHDAYTHDHGEGVVAAIARIVAVTAGSAGNLASGGYAVTSDVAGLTLLGIDTAITNGSDDSGSAAIYAAGYDSTEAKWNLRAASEDASNTLVSEFRSAFALAAMRSNDGGDPVLHFDVELAGSTYTGKVYQTGEVTQPDPIKTVEHSLYESSVAARVVYPRFVVEGDGDATGRLDITISVNGVEFDVPDPDEDPIEEISG